MSGERFTVWVFSNRRRGISKFRLSFTALLILPFFLSFSLVIISLVLAQSVGVLSIGWGSLSFLSSAGSGDQRASSIGASGAGYDLGISLTAGDSSGSNSGGATPGEYKEALKRVKEYESQLKLRAAAIGAVFKDTKGLDGVAVDAPRDGQKLSSIGGDTLTSELVPFGELAKQGSGWGRGSALGGGDTERGSVLSRLRRHRQTEHSKNGGISNTPKGRSVLELLDAQIDRLRHLPFGLPVFGEVSSGFGARVSPFTGRIQGHEGIDFSLESQSGVVAVADGVVTVAGPHGAYGLAVVIDHGNGIETLYGHLSRLDIKPGERVCRGKQIGQVGSTGRSTGPHLHYEVRIEGTAVDPRQFIELVNVLRLLA